jgi:hypothetical protein
MGIANDMVLWLAKNLFKRLICIHLRLPATPVGWHMGYLQDCPEDGYAECLVTLGRHPERNRTLERILHGVNKKVIKSSITVKFGFINLRLPPSLSAVIRDEVHVQGFLTPGLNPNLYATGATPEDPARRLSIQLTIENDQGRFQEWATAGGGDQTAKQINTLVEILEGVPDEEITKRPRRFLGRNKYKGRLRTSYTSVEA